MTSIELPTVTNNLNYYDFLSNTCSDICIICIHPCIAFSYELNTDIGYCGICFDYYIDYCYPTTEFECCKITCCCCCLTISNILHYTREFSTVKRVGYVNCFTIIPPFISGICGFFICSNALLCYPFSGRKYICNSIKTQTNWYYGNNTYILV